MITLEGPQLYPQLEKLVLSHRPLLRGAAGSAALYATFKLLGYLIRQYYFIPRLTILKDIPLLGKPRKDAKKLAGKAVICGGSIAGLLSAAVCADHFDTVVVIEPEAWVNDPVEGTTVAPCPRPLRTTPDGWPTPITRRARVPQYESLNFLQPPVYFGLAALFPNLHATLGRRGYQLIVARGRFHIGGVCVEDPYAGVDLGGRAPVMITLTRDALETTIRKMLRETRPNVKFRSATVTSLVAAADGKQVQKVTYRGTEGQASDEAGDIFIDCTGLNHAAYSRWISSSNGFTDLPKSIFKKYDPKMLYSTSTWKLCPEVKKAWPSPGGYVLGNVLALIPDVKTGETNSLIIALMENDQLLITTGGRGRPAIAHSLQETRVFLSALHGSELVVPWIWDLIDLLEKHQEACNPHWIEYKPGSFYWIKYHEALDMLPGNFIAIGDSSMRLNPVYAQGVTHALGGATTLNACLRSFNALEYVKEALATTFFSKAVPRVAGIWEATKLSDYAFSVTTPCDGENLDDNATRREYGYRVMMLGRKDDYIRSIWWHVVMQLAPATDMLSPWIIWRVGWDWILSSICAVF